MGPRMEDFRCAPAECLAHWIQCSYSVLGTAGTPLTPTCWNTLWHRAPPLLTHISFFISVFCSLRDLLKQATDRAALQSGIKQEIGLTVLPTILTTFFLKACVCLANVRIHSNTQIWNKVHMTTEKMCTHHERCINEINWRKVNGALDKAGDRRTGKNIKRRKQYDFF